MDSDHSARIRRDKSPDVVWADWNIPREERERLNGHRAAVLWFTGLSAAGKSTVARGLERTLYDRKCRTMLLDGDQVRHGLCSDLAFTDEDRVENIRRVAETARLFFEQGNIVLCAFISPFRLDRDFARGLVPPGRFFEVYVKCSVETASKRDPKKLYERALRGEIPNFTGVSSPYEPPEHPEVVLDSDHLGPDVLMDEVLQLLTLRRII